MATVYLQKLQELRGSELGLIIKEILGYGFKPKLYTLEN